MLSLTASAEHLVGTPVGGSERREGRCLIWLGPMMSGKSTNLRVQLAMLADLDADRQGAEADGRETHTKRVALINYAADAERIGSVESAVDGLTSHGSHYRGVSPKISVHHIYSLARFPSEDFDVIGIDEGQFFADLSATVRRWVLAEGKTVLIASLDGDFRMEPFGQVMSLVPIASLTVKLLAWCKLCPYLPRAGLQPSPAPFTSRLTETESQVDIGGSDKYIPTCLHCHQLIDSARGGEPEGLLAALHDLFSGKGGRALKRILGS